MAAEREREREEMEERKTGHPRTVVVVVVLLSSFPKQKSPTFVNQLRDVTIHGKSF